MVVKTYRGLLAHGVQEKIPLSTKDGSVGYRIVKFQIMANNPQGANSENVVQIYKKSTTPTLIIDFTDSDLLAAGILNNYASANAVNQDTVIFDNEIFNQDIYITAMEDVGSLSVNYYIELEQMKLDHTQNMSATLKAIRGTAVD